MDYAHANPDIDNSSVQFDLKFRATQTRQSQSLMTLRAFFGTTKRAKILKLAPHLAVHSRSH